MSTTLCFIDTETTGLDPRVHKPWEVCTWIDGEQAPETRALPHTLELADPQALNIGGYWDRAGAARVVADRGSFTRRLRGVTLVGSNPAFDAAMLTPFIGMAVWHHRLINVAEGGMWVFGWDRPRGLADVAAECRSRGYDIPEPDHTAEGDVRATRAVYEALRAIRATTTADPERAALAEGSDT